MFSVSTSFFSFLELFYQSAAINLSFPWLHKMFLSIASDHSHQLFLYLVLKILSSIGIQAPSYTHQFFPSVPMCKTTPSYWMYHIFLWYESWVFFPHFHEWKPIGSMKNVPDVSTFILLYYISSRTSIFCLNFCWDLVIEYPCLHKTVYTLSFKQQLRWFFSKQWPVSSRRPLKIESRF